LEGAGRICTFQLDHQWFGIAVERVQEVLPVPSITPVPLAPSAVAGLVNLRGQIVTVIDPRCRLGLPGRPACLSPVMVVVRSEDAVVGLLADEIGEVVEAPPEAFEAAPANLPVQLQQLVPEVCRIPGHLLHVLDLDAVLRVEAEYGPSRRRAVKGSRLCAD